MSTDDLIDRLANALVPARSNAVSRRVVLGAGGGIVLSAALMVALLGLRPDFAEALSTTPFWIKFVYVAVASLAGLVAVLKLSRPAGRIARPTWLAGLLLTIVAVMAIAQFASAPDGERPALVYGGSALVCPIFIVLLALPIHAGVIWAMRGLAPTRTRLAGLAAGLGAGSFSALVYSFHCDETSVVFLALWYSLGIMATGLVGLSTSRFLRW